MSTILKESQKDVIVNEIRYSFRRASYCRFTRPIRFDTENVIKLDSRVTILWKGETAFIGRIKSVHSEISPNGERVVCEAVGPREELSHRPLIKEDSASIIYNEQENTMTIGDIFLDVLKEVPGDVIASYTGPIASMDVKPGKIEFSNVTIDQALQTLIDKAGHFGFYITSKKILTVVDFDNQVTTNIYVGQLGEQVKNHPEYNLISCDLNHDITGCYAKCIVEGSRVRQEGFLTLIPDWDKSIEEQWTYGKYLQTLRGLPYIEEISPLVHKWIWLDERYLDVYRRYKIPHKERIRRSLITGGSLRVFVWSSFADPGTYFHPIRGDEKVRSYPGGFGSPDTFYLDPNQQHRWGWYGGYEGEIDLDAGTVIFKEPICSWEATGGITLSYIKSAVKDRMYYPPWFWKLRPAQASLLCVIEKEPFSVVVGPVGTAYTEYEIIRTKYIYNESFIKEIIDKSVKEWKSVDSPLPVDICRDDSADMIYFATETLKGIQNVKYNGTLVVDGIDLSIKPKNKLNIFNTDKSEWLTMNANIIEVTYNFENESMRLTLTSERGLV